MATTVEQWAALAGKPPKYPLTGPTPLEIDDDISAQILPLVESGQITESEGRSAAVAMRGTRKWARQTAANIEAVRTALHPSKPRTYARRRAGASRVRTRRATASRLSNCRAGPSRPGRPRPSADDDPEPPLDAPGGAA
jgi:hypothetical protein